MLEISLVPAPLHICHSLVLIPYERPWTPKVEKTSPQNPQQ